MAMAPLLADEHGTFDVMGRLFSSLSQKEKLFSSVEFSAVPPQGDHIVASMQEHSMLRSQTFTECGTSSLWEAE